MLSAFPTPVGMNLLVVKIEPTYGGVPHTRGDEPNSA